MPRKKLDRDKLMGFIGYIIMGCNKATYLLSKREEGKLTPKESVRLKLHLVICKWCSRFEKQTSLFTRHAKHMHQDQNLSAEKKEKIKSLLKD